MAVLRSEGNFYSTYPLIILGILAVLFTCVCCFVILMGADQVGKGLKEIDDFFMNIDNLDSIQKAMKKKAEEEFMKNARGQDEEQKHQ